MTMKMCLSDMTRDDIIRMAREAGIGETPGWFNCVEEELERFAELVAAAEREACAKQLESLGNDHCAAAIRSRGNG
jgi:hypothetical protein